MNQITFPQQLNQIIDQGHLLKHPFYQMWNQGQLTKNMLQKYALEYYHQVHYFPTYISATHANCDDISIRQMLLQNLIEEETGPHHHPQLWLQFAQGIGCDRTEVLNHQPLPQTLTSVETLKQLSRHQNPAVGMAALYAYESQIPQVSTTKIAGLEQHYQINHPATLAFFKVHETADEIHSQMTLQALIKLTPTPLDQELALEATQKAVFAFNLLLDGVYQEYCH